MPDGHVYFIQADHGGPVKIGWARDPTKRLRELQTGHPHRLVVRATIPASLRQEAELHRRFAEHRLSGEWFDPTPDLEQAAGCVLIFDTAPPAPTRPRPATRMVLLCDTCKKREAVFVDLRPWAQCGAHARLLCVADECPDEGYWFEIERFVNGPDYARHDKKLDEWICGGMREHLIDDKDCGHQLVWEVEERLKRKQKLVPGWVPQ